MPKALPALPGHTKGSFGPALTLAELHQSQGEFALAQGPAPLPSLALLSEAVQQFLMAQEMRSSAMAML